MQILSTCREAAERKLVLVMTLAGAVLVASQPAPSAQAEYPSPQVSVRLIDFDKSQWIAAPQLATFLGERLVLEYDAAASTPSGGEEWVIQTLMIDKEGKAVGGCHSGPITMARGRPGRTRYLCRAGSLVRELGDARLSFGNTTYVDGKPVNLGLWAPDHSGEADLTLAAMAIPRSLSDSCGSAQTGWPCKWSDREIEAAMGTVQGKALVLALKYPIEHGI